MAVIAGLEQVGPDLHGCVLTIGNFDGVHRGHQQIIAQAGMFAAETAAPLVVLTFDPHPLAIVAPQRAPATLMSVGRRTRRLRQAGADHVVVARSDPDLLAMPPQRFVEESIVGRFRPGAVVEGRSFGFGKGREGTVELLCALGDRFGFRTTVVEPVTLQIVAGESLPISSSLVRRLVSQGQVRRARYCLGRPYAVHGVVQPGHRRGESLGFPTANLGEVGELLPAEGVYAGRGRIGRHSFSAAISIGTTPTFDGGRLQVEAHLIGHQGPLYDRMVTLEFTEFLRPQRKFDSIDALKRQIATDVRAVAARAEFGDEIEGEDG